MKIYSRLYSPGICIANKPPTWLYLLRVCNVSRPQITLYSPMVCHGNKPLSDCTQSIYTLWVVLTLDCTQPRCVIGIILCVRLFPSLIYSMRSRPSILYLYKGDGAIYWGGRFELKYTEWSGYMNSIKHIEQSEEIASLTYILSTEDTKTFIQHHKLKKHTYNNKYSFVSSAKQY